MKPLLIDLYCGLGGWAEGFLAEGWECVGFDVERHRYPRIRHIPSATKLAGNNGGKGAKVWSERAIQRLKDSIDDCEVLDQWQEYPGQLVLQDALTLHGSQFKNADCIVASPPCTEYSYMAMPWSRGKQIARALRGQGEFPEGYTGSRTIEQLNALFNACFRIQREAIDATTRNCPSCGGKGFMIWYVNETHDCERCYGKGYVQRYIPLIVENVKGAQPWVGRAKANYGSFYLWADVGMVGRNVTGPGLKFGELCAPAKNGQKFNPDGTAHGPGSWFKIANSRERGQKINGPRRDRQLRSGEFGWHKTIMADGTSKSAKRKAASAQIAKIPFALSSYIARVYHPQKEERESAAS